MVFFHLSNGTYINSDQVTRLVPISEYNGKRRVHTGEYNVFVGDTMVGDVRLSDDSMDGLTHKIIPAQPGQEAVMVWAEADDNTLEVDVTVNHYHVIGWAIATAYGLNNFIRPIVSASLCCNDEVFVRQPDGSYEAYEERYDSLEKLVQHETDEAIRFAKKRVEKAKAEQTTE